MLNALIHAFNAVVSILFAFCVGGFEIAAFASVSDWPKLLAAVGATLALIWWGKGQAEYIGVSLNGS